MGIRSEFLLVVGAAAYVSGCAVGPDYQLPDISVPRMFGMAESAPALQNTTSSGDIVRWWLTLHDRELNSLVARAVTSNPDIEIALTRVQAARTQEIVVLGAALPKVNISAGAAAGTGTDLTKGRVAQSIRAGTNNTGLILSRVAGFDAGWEVDLFGKYLRLLEAVRADAEALMEARNAVLITVIADVVRNYMDIRGLQSRLEIARSDVVTGQKTVDLVQTRFNRGLTNELDVTLAKRQLATLQARLPEVTSAISAAESRLAVLLGTYSGAIEEELKRSGKLPRIPQRLRPGVPVDLLRRRPDIRQAERDLAGATARIGVATADLFPSVALIAGFGAQGGERQHGAAAPIHGPIWSLGPGAYWPFLDFGRLDALIDIQELHAHELMVNYKKTILVAVAEVDDAIKQFRAQQERLKDLGIALEESRRAVSLATERYERGLTDFLNVLDAQRQEYELEDQNAVAQEVLTIQLIVFYKALGGGWELYDVLPPIPEAQPAILATIRRLSNHWH
jgi:NodT family efflux transporter outer membrane factor (OMF) lipoprotein